MAMTARAAKLMVLGSIIFGALGTFAQNRKEFKFTVQPGGTVSIINEFGPVTIRPATGRQVVVTATLPSDKVEIDQIQSGNRVQVRTHLQQPKMTADQARVAYEVTVPPDVSITLRSANGPITVERMRGDITAEGDTAPIDVHDVSNGHVHLRSMGGPVKLTNVSNANLEVTSVSGPVDMNNVTGPKLEVNTTSGKITYAGNFGNNGDYSFTNHNGDIDVFVPANVSVDLAARSLKGSVENDLQVAPRVHAPGFAAQNDAGRALSGTVNSGGSSVQIRSFSGKIRVKKQ
jgi:DUF4097 and DUF4098 domain-containing protein YvlB